MPVPHVDIFGLTKHRFPSKIVIFCSFLTILKTQPSKPEVAVSLFGIYAFQTILSTSPFFPVTCPDVSQGLLFCALGWCDGVFKNRPDLDFAPFPGRFRRSRLLRDLPSRAARPWVGFGCSAWREALSLPGSLLAKMGAKKCDVSEFIKSTRNIHFKGR